MFNLRHVFKSLKSILALKISPLNCLFLSQLFHITSAKATSLSLRELFSCLDTQDLLFGKILTVLVSDTGSSQNRIHNAIVSASASASWQDCKENFPISLLEAVQTTPVFAWRQVSLVSPQPYIWARV